MRLERIKQAEEEARNKGKKPRRRRDDDGDGVEARRRGRSDDQHRDEHMRDHHEEDDDPGVIRLTSGGNRSPEQTRRNPDSGPSRFKLLPSNDVGSPRTSRIKLLPSNENASPPKAFQSNEQPRPLLGSKRTKDQAQGPHDEEEQEA